MNSHMDSSSSLKLFLIGVIITHAVVLSTYGVSAERTTLHAASGEFSTPNYPDHYGNNQEVFTDILLQPYETIRLISGEEYPEFERCCDRFTIEVNGIGVMNLTSRNTTVGEDWWTYSADNASAVITLHFKSDYSERRKGLKGSYKISCSMGNHFPDSPKKYPNGCVFGTCELGRTTINETKPITCSCPGGYLAGKRCEHQLDKSASSVVIQLSDVTGEIATPNYYLIQPYNLTKNVTWKVQLHEHEEIEFFRETGEIPDFEPNCTTCETLTLNVDGSPLVDFREVSFGIGGTSLVKVQAGSGESKLVEVVLFIDGDAAGKGLKILYRITCDTDASSFSKWCMNGGSCALQSDVNAASSSRLQKVCTCPKTSTGPKCENKVNFTTETVSLKNAVGFIETPNFPVHYPVAKNITWNLSLQRFESIVINLVQTSGTPDFEVCCDYVGLIEDGVETKRLSETFLSNKNHLEKYAGPKELLVKFVSDGRVTGRGMKLQYRIACSDRSCLNGGSCSVTRSEQSVAPVRCSCPKHYHGPRCEHRRVYITEIRPVFSPAGIAETPNFPSLYPNGSSIVWRWQLQEFERITFQVDRRELHRSPDFEQCCDDFRLLHGETVLGDFGKGQYRDTIVVQGSKNSSKDVTLQFMSDENTEGRGMRLKFAIDCHNNISEGVCLNGGTCVLNRSAHSAGPVTCLCPKGFTGSRCQEHVGMQSETYHLSDSSSGYFKTPNYPSTYPPRHRITWHLALHPFEVLTVEKVDSFDPDFEECCDSLHLKVNGALRYDFKSAKGKPESAVLETISAEHEKLDITITFSSDGGNGGQGFRGRYSITCIEGREIDAENACLNGGVCSLARTTTSVHPVQCKCAKNFQGPRCEKQKTFTTDVVDVHAPLGIIETPNFPDAYPSSTNIVWRWHLHAFEKLTVQLDVDAGSGPDFEECCDTFHLKQGKTLLANFASKTESPQGIVAYGSSTGHFPTTEVILNFMSDGEVEGRGARVKYFITCHDVANEETEGHVPCFNGGACSLARNETSSGSVVCMCPKGFMGARCQDPVQLLSETIQLQDQSGYFQTPNYPSMYPPGHHITWQLALQPFEVLKVEKGDPFGADFEECCDFLHLKVNGALRYDFKSARGKPEGTVLETIRASEHKKLDITITFSSDGGNGGKGFRGRYSITCIEGRDIDAENACLNGGVCSVARTTTSVNRVQCKCAKHFQGPRCKDPVHVSSELHHMTSSRQTITTPGFPDYYENSRRITWTWDLKQYEILRLKKTSYFASNLEDCCDHLTLSLGSEMHCLNELIRDVGAFDILTIHANHKTTQVSLAFTSDGAINGPGVQIEYSIGCQQVEACLDNGTCLVTSDVTYDKRCLDSKCPQHPWVQNAQKDGCFLLGDKQVDERATPELCHKHHAHLAEILTAKDNAVIGKEAQSPLVWIGLSDADSEGDWKWVKSGKSALFAKWGPGYPTEQGDHAVMYPSRWTLNMCSEKKRFLCETKDPYCPSKWIRPENNGRCYYQSKYALDFESAASMCSLMVPGGQLARWDGETALSFGPDQWDTSPAEGPAHFWIGIGACRRITGMSDTSHGRVSTTVADKGNKSGGDGSENAAKIYFLPLPSAQLQPSPKDPEFTASLIADHENHHPENNLCGTSMVLDRCAFLYPNAWADYSSEGKEPSHWPAVACQKATTIKFIHSGNASETLLLAPTVTFLRKYPNSIGEHPMTHVNNTVIWTEKND